ncbi:hypothetical protein JOQ06_013447 [Pogonophryne albipinna]|uniref:Uncharacterized protein n=1 Tax=Pogonophryne albipinna TaxID=1090488 RepID=A0AAD6BHP1_9TELE|nr:hypothetical protein JOQ06_013447 [Pogonophryne albipinna]
MYDYLKRAGELWEDSTGARHNNSLETMVLCRDQVIKGLPKPVQTALEDVLNLETQPFHDWKQTVTHWYTIHQRKMDQEDDEVRALTKQLLKTQVAEKDNETNKKKAKAMPQMSAMSKLHHHNPTGPFGQDHHSSSNHITPHLEEEGPEADTEAEVPPGTRTALTAVPKITGPRNAHCHSGEGPRDPRVLTALDTEEWPSCKDDCKSTAQNAQ